MYQVGIITSSDSGAAGLREDVSGRTIAKLLPTEYYTVVSYVILPDDRKELLAELMRLSDEKGCNLILTTGGTGFSDRDIMPEVTLEAATRQVPGIAEAIRVYSMTKTKRAMLSRGVSVIRNHSLIINLPGSPKAVAEIMEYILDTIPHGLDVLSGEAKECADDSIQTGA